MTQPTDTPDDRRRRKVRRTAIIAALVAVGIYALAILNVWMAK